MIGPAEISAGITSLRFAYDIAKSLKDVADATDRNSKILDLQGAIMEAQSGAIEAQQLHAADIKRIAELELEIARMKAWDSDKLRYELKSINGSGFVYALKSELAAGEPPHWLCPNCYQTGEKRILQMIPTGWGSEWGCPACKQIVYISEANSPERYSGT